MANYPRPYSAYILAIRDDVHPKMVDGEKVDNAE
jgi:hypothetical protein